MTVTEASSLRALYNLLLIVSFGLIQSRSLSSKIGGDKQRPISGNDLTKFFLAPTT
jgi:hypothetical protein